MVLNRRSSISIVIPIHNMEGRLSNLFAWLPEAIYLGQQVILVFNACTDGTWAEVENFLTNKGITSVITTICDEIGPGNARNHGMKFTTNDYTVFWDSDDIGYPKRLQEIVDSHTVDFCLVAQYELNKPTKRHNFEKIAQRENLLSFIVNPGIWRCVFNTSAIHEIKFGFSKMGEDQVFLAKILARFTDIEYSEIIIYRYYVDQPFQLTSNAKNIEDLLSAANEVEKVACNSSGYAKDLIFLLLSRICLTGIKRGRNLLRVKFLIKLIRIMMKDFNFAKICRIHRLVRPSK